MLTANVDGQQSWSRRTLVKRGGNTGTCRRGDQNIFKDFVMPLSYKSISNCRTARCKGQVSNRVVNAQVVGRHSRPLDSEHGAAKLRYHPAHFAHLRLRLGVNASAGPPGINWPTPAAFQGSAALYENSDHRPCRGEIVGVFLVTARIPFSLKMTDPAPLTLTRPLAPMWVLRICSSRLTCPLPGSSGPSFRWDFPDI
jgi:hypothetical protein